MKYLCLIYQDEKQVPNIPKAEMQQFYAEYQTVADDLKRNGQYLASNGLQPTNTATTVRVRNGKMSTTDGPFVETKERAGAALP